MRCKRLFIMIALISIFVLGNEPDKLVTGCKVVGKGIVMCETYKANRTTVYHFKKDGSVVEKIYQGSPTEYGIKSDRQVFTSVVDKVDSWPCLEKNGYGGKYKIVSGDCFTMFSSFSKKIAGGEYLHIVYFGSDMIPLLLGQSRPVGKMICESTTRVTTFRVNDVTGYLSDMNVYESLKHGTYCEDFLATDALYWKP